MNESTVKTINARSSARSSQRGISLLFALLALAAMMLAAVALVRSVDSGALVLGNLGFKQDATGRADFVAERARAAIMGMADPTQDGPPGSGYYATSQDALDPTGRVTSAANKLAVVNWGDSDSCACVTATPATCSVCRPASDEVPGLANGVKARYVVTRLCPSVGTVSDTNACAKPAALAISQSASKNEVKVGGETTPDAVALVPYYRIIVRTVGARGAVSFTETIVY